MLTEFVTFCEQLFPNIDPYIADEARKVMEQFESYDGHLMNRTLGFDCLQGDLYSEIPFVFIDDDGSVGTINCKALLLSNTCDASRNDTLLFAAVRPLSDFSENPGFVSSISGNRTYNTLYFPDRIISDSFVDFGLITTISRESFEEMAQKGLIERLASLTLVGYYMLICKLTIFFLRPEDPETNKNRDTVS